MEQEPKIEKEMNSPEIILGDLKTELENLRKLIERFEKTDSLKEMSEDDLGVLTQARRVLTNTIGDMEYLEEENRNR